MAVCLGNLSASSVLAYSNRDLIANGFIPETGTVAKGFTSNRGSGIITTRETVKLLPANRMYNEFWFGVSTRITGTNFGDLGAGAIEALGFLGLGAGLGIATSFACSLVGDSERAVSNFVYHVCESETRLNREIVLTAQNISSKTITLPDYVMGVLGITHTPIEFVTPKTPLSQKQKDAAKATPANQVEAILGQRVAPDQLTDTQMRLILGIAELNELDTIGSSEGRTRGWKTSSEGQILATFKNFSYSDPSNLFTGVLRDPRKNLYRADNDTDKNDGNCFWNGSTDDLTDKVVKFNTSLSTNTTDNAVLKLKAGDKVYISYVAVTKTIFRHAMSNTTNFFLFPDQSVYQMPPLDLVKSWNFKKKKFKVRIKPDQKATLNDILNDASIQEQIAKAQADNTLSDTEKANTIKRLQNKILLEDMESQRLIETKLEHANRNPFIKGCYLADSRGIIQYDLANGGAVTVIFPKSSIRDQDWFNAYLDSIKTSLDQNGQLDFSKINNFLDDFLFDMSDHVNTACYDNDKYGYERRFANALSKCSVYNKDDPKSGVGIPNLDLVKNKLSGRTNFDLSSAKFESVPMQGIHQLFACNVTFTYDFGFCTKGTVKADMLLRTPFFLETYGKTARVYVEQYSPQLPLRPDAAIWVGTSPVSQDNYAVTTNPGSYFGFLVYPDSDSQSTNFRVFEDGILTSNLNGVKYELPSDPSKLPTIDTSLTEKSMQVVGYDNIIGSQPNYFKGLQITTESAQILMGRIEASTINVDKLTFTREASSGRVNVSGVSGKRFRTLKIVYRPTSSKFLDNSERLISLIFPGSKTVVDNIALPFQGKFSTDNRTLAIDLRYVAADSFFIDGEILKLVEIVSIEACSLLEEDYQKYKFYGSKISTCFDYAGNWFVFYEDEDGADGETGKDGRLADGSHLKDAKGTNPGLSSATATEISCVMSPDYGDNWYVFKALVRTVVGDVVGAPYVLPDYLSNKIHLFYTLNNSLMHKVIDSNLFEYSDAFLGYKRPNNLDANTMQSYGLYHFTENGIKMREKPSSVVIGNVNGDYLTKQTQITNAIIKANRDDYRLFISGDGKNYEKGFPEIDYVSYVDGAGHLKVMFVSDSKFYCRMSADNGISWFDVLKEGILIHRNSNTQELKSVSNLGLAFNSKTNYTYLTYQVDEMLFLRVFEAGVSNDSEFDIKEVLDPSSKKSLPIFVVGNMVPELKTSIKNKNSLVLFPYSIDEVDTFNDSYAISPTISLGYVTSSGQLRFFYKDSGGNFRGISFTERPELDVGYTKVE